MICMRALSTVKNNWSPRTKGHAFHCPVFLFRTGFPLKSTEPSPV